MTPRPLVLLLPHPDDEFAVFAWIDAALSEGRPVHCIWLTDGGWGGQAVSRRRVESETVLARMGLAAASFHFLGEQVSIPDGALHLHIVRAYEAVKDCIAGIGQDPEVMVPAWEGGHQDHDSAHLIGRALAQHRSLDMVQYPIYHGEGLSGPMFRILSPLTANGPTRFAPATVSQRVRYVLYCLHYRSQWKSFVGLLPFYALRMVSRHPFQHQDLQAGRTRQRPHEGPLLYERRGGPPHQAIIDAGKVLETCLRDTYGVASEIV